MEFVGVNCDFFFLLLFSFFPIFIRIRKILIVNISDEILARSILYESSRKEKRDLIYQTNAFSIIQLVRRGEEFVSISRK